MRTLEESRGTSTILVQADTVLDSVDPRIYGQNIEHMGRQVLGGLVAEPGSTAPRDERGFRTDVQESILDLRPTLLRWPGGCFADSYHWRDGIGAHRPAVPNRMWGGWLIGKIFGSPPFPLGPLEDNRFGTDEFMALCRSAGAEPSLTASLGADEPQEAADWVAYVRDRYGEGAVPIWSVGNEQWNIVEPNGCANHPARYVERFHRFASAMRAADPRIRLVASGGDAFTLPRWNEEVIRGIGASMDLLSMHLYLPAWIPLRSHVGDSPGAFRAIAASGLFLEEQILRIEETAQRLIGRALPIAFDEWNILGPLRRFTDPYRSLREAIGVAGILHAFHRQARFVKTAAMFAMINAAAPPIITTRDSLVRTPIHRVLGMYRRLTGTKRVRTETECPVAAAPPLLNLPPRKTVPVLDVSATREGDRLTIFVINRDPDEHHGARVDLPGSRSPNRARVHSIAGAGYSAENTVDDREVVVERVSEIEWRGSIRFPPCSVTAIVLEP
jgi:alpha-N-arabinofuranosidase